MFYGKLFSFFIQGVVVGSGPCLLTCAPILLPYLAATRRDWREGLRLTLLFGLARLVVYALLGSLVGYAGAYLFQLFYGEIWGKAIWALAGTGVALIGLLIAAGKESPGPFCRLAQREENIVFLGVMVGLAPCLPLLAVLTEIMLLADHFFQGLIYGAAFGLGTILSPLLLFGPLAPLVPADRRRQEIACGLILFCFGFYLVWRVMG
jgi:sulfite exporter TauE/SafE